MTGRNMPPGSWITGPRHKASTVVNKNLTSDPAAALFTRVLFGWAIQNVDAPLKDRNVVLQRRRSRRTVQSHRLRAFDDEADNNGMSVFLWRSSQSQTMWRHAHDARHLFIGFNRAERTVPLSHVLWPTTSILHVVARSCQLSDNIFSFDYSLAMLLMT